MYVITDHAVRVKQSSCDSRSYSANEPQVCWARGLNALIGMLLLAGSLPRACLLSVAGCKAPITHPSWIAVECCAQTTLNRCERSCEAAELQDFQQQWWPPGQCAHVRKSRSDAWRRSHTRPICVSILVYWWKHFRILLLHSHCLSLKIDTSWPLQKFWHLWYFCSYIKWNI